MKTINKIKVRCMKNFFSTRPILVFVFLLLSIPALFAQAPTPVTGDYGSVANGVWSSVSTWKQWDGTGWNTTPSGAPGSSAQVFILTGTTVTYDNALSNSNNCKNLIVQSGAIFQSDQTIPSGVLVILKVNGPTIWVDGTLGKDATDAFSIETKYNGTITLSGSGTVNLAELRPNSSQSGTLTVVFGLNANINYAGTTGLGGAGIYLSRGSQTSSTITINPGVTVNFAANSNFMNSSVAGALGKMNITLNVNGTMNASSVILPDTAGYAVSLNVGSTGILNVAQTLTPWIKGVNSDGAIATINVASGGAINILNGGTADFTNPTSKVTGAGTFSLKAGGTINIGSLSGLDPAAGPIQTTNAAYDTASNFSYVGTGLQVFGLSLSAIVNNLTIGTNSIDSVTTALKTNGVLTINGTLINNGGLTSNGTAIVNGTYQHNTSTGAVPLATWNTGSLCLFTAFTAVTTGYINGSQNYYNVKIDFPGCNTSARLGFNGNTINGNLTVHNTNDPTSAGNNYVALFSKSGTSPITIMGNVIIDSSAANLSIGTGSTSVVQKLIVHGDIISSGALFLNGSGVSNILYTYGNITIQNTNVNSFRGHSSSSAPDSVIFCGTGIQKLTKPALLHTIDNVRMRLASGSTLYIDDTTLVYITGSSPGSFAVDSGATLKCGNPAGLNGAFTWVVPAVAPTLSTNASYEFNSLTAQTTGLLIPSTVKNLIFSNASTDTLAKSVTVTGTATIGSGATVVESAGKYILGTATTTQPVGTGAVSNIGGLGVGLNAGTDNLGTVTITRTAGPTGVITVAAHSSINRSWVITSVTPPSAGRDLTLSWDALDNNGKDLTTAQAYISTDAGAQWTAFGSQQNATATQSVTVSTTSFSNWTVSDAANTLPVELTSFTARLNGTSVNLTWHTATELNNTGFDVERNFNSGSWEKISFIKGAGNSNSIRNYSFSDSKLSKTGNYSYRLKQVDNNGTFKYSNIVEVNFTAPHVYSLSQNYPNPFNPSTVIEYSLPKGTNVKLLVYNAIGQTVKILENGFQDAGYYHITFNASALPSGIYFYKIEAGQFSQIKKMMLVK